MYLVLECDVETVDTPNNPLYTRRKLTIHKTFRRCPPTAQKMKLSNKDFFSKCDQMVTFTEVILNGKLHFFCAAMDIWVVYTSNQVFKRGS